METSVTNITRMHDGRFVETTDELAIEQPLQIQLLFGSSGNEQRRNLAITMRTPGNDEELVAGFLFTEGIISKKYQLLQVINEASGENTVLAILRGNHMPDLQTADRNFYVNSSCGVCGKSSIDAVRKQIEYPVTDEQIQISASVLFRLPETLRRQQQAFASTGGLHACALFDENGQLAFLREDIGRHNALDKLIGNAFLKEQLPLHKNILLLSGRASFELVQKAAVAGVRIIAAIGAPSSLAVQLATEANISLIGFLKSDRFNVYSGPERIVDEGEQI